MSDEQQLNSLERFRKQSPRLVLEEHGHCEVPAGCGGVVLRWRNPDTAVGVIFQLYTPGVESLFIDGAPVRATRTDLAPKTHVLSIVIEQVDLSGGLLILALEQEPSKQGAVVDVLQQRLKVVTLEDRTWRYRLVMPDPPPGDEWMSLSFEDSNWPALVRVPTPQLEASHHGRYACQRCIGLGAEFLGLLAAPEAGTMGTIRIRKVFDVRPSDPPR